MLKVKLLIVALLFAGLANAQIFKNYSGNWRAKGFWKHDKAIVIEDKTVSGAKVDKWDAAAADLENDVDLEGVFVLKDEYTNENLIKGLRELGYKIKYLPLADFAMQTGNTLVDGRQYLTIFKVTKPVDTITGITYAVSVPGEYVADGFNGFAIYKREGTSFTKLGETPNTPNMWKVTAGTPTDIAFTSPIIVTEGYYYISNKYDSSSQVAAPQTYCMEVWQSWFTDMGAVKLGGYLTSATFGETITNASMSRNNIPYFFPVY